MSSELNTNAGTNDYKSPKATQNQTQHTTDNEYRLRADRLGIFTNGPPSTILFSDLDPKDIKAAHKARISAELNTILPRLP
ncbi:uncharacterized protein F4807DRAFT_465367 [Annulohypoxylon truncatum]|uniref:uncharacterized protein n=1 Tax=Annulohypoxylon truncatum TaxID=327061 RepID=UPI0020077B1F|nr:uncharacterized protein F4807DRAFT_465367 [Annulohypoxylon truncatum]KAI1204725.1 hypothetical protein F4807DRAFT_465367 [Annulohypoxylon truncatum]